VAAVVAQGLEVGTVVKDAVGPGGIALAIVLVVSKLELVGRPEGERKL
jgi:hypothetical protein